MFTPSDIQDKQFKTGLGYEKKDVEQFLQDISSDYTILLMENDDLKKKLKEANEGLSYYKSIEKTLQKALVLAEKTAQDTRVTAIKEAEVIEREAKAKAQQILIEAQKQLELYEHRMMNLTHQYDLFKINFQNLLKSQQELLNSRSFSVNTEEFTYREDTDRKFSPKAGTPEDLVKGQAEADEATEDSLQQEDVNQLKFDFIHEDIGSGSYQTEDGFEFFTMKD
jgi:cell division initiation protein